MATLVFTDCKIYIAQYDMSGDINQVQLNVGAEMVENTTFGATARTKKAGLYTVDYNLNGFANYGSNLCDETLFAQTGNINVPHTLVPEGNAIGNVAYIFRGAQASYSPGGQVGEMIKFSVNGGVSGGAAIRAKILEPGTSMRTSNASGNEVLVGAASASQRVFVAVHVLEKQGNNATLDLIVQSDTTGFPSPANQITVAQFNNTLGSSWNNTAAGAITDTFYRVGWTIGGTAEADFWT